MFILLTACTKTVDISDTPFIQSIKDSNDVKIVEILEPPKFLNEYTKIESTSYVKYSEDTKKSKTKETIFGKEIEYQYVSGYIGEVHLNKGWNLVKGDLTYRRDSILQDSEITANDIKVFNYFPASQNMFQMHPEPSRDQVEFIFGQLEPIEREINKYTAQWIYSEKSGILKKQFQHYWNIELLWEGWNLISLDPPYEGKTLADFTGNCQIDEAAGYGDAWIDWNIDRTITEKDLGKGLAIQVPKDCLMYEVFDNKEIIEVTETEKIGHFVKEENHRHPDDGEQCFNDICLSSKSVKYNAADKAITVHLGKITKGELSDFKKLIDPTNKIAPGVYGSAESHEMYWFPTNGYDYIATQEYNTRYDDGSITAVYSGTDINNPVIEHFLTLYPPSKV